MKDIKVGQTFLYQIQRTGNKMKNPIEAEVIICGLNIERVGITKDMVLVKLLGQESKPFYVKKSNLITK